MKTLQISNSNSNVNRSSSSLRASSSGIETAKKMKTYESAAEVTSTVDEENVSEAQAELDSINNAAAKREDLLSADEEECVPGATKSSSKPQQAKIDAKKEPKTNVAPLAPTKVLAVKEVSPVPKELAKESEDERECYRHAIVDVPVLLELLRLIGRCPVCKSSLRTDKIATDEKTAVVNVSLKCSRLRCQFTKHWCSSPTAGISADATEPASK